MTRPLPRSRQSRRAILEALGTADELSLSEVAEESALSKRQAWTHLKDLHADGLVEWEERDGVRMWRAA